MPFVTKEHRENPNLSIPGDLCYYYYKQMVDEWKSNPRWTTAAEIYRNMKVQTQQSEFCSLNWFAVSAYELAWQVFFQKYVMPYEDQKEKENGTI